MTLSKNLRWTHPQFSWDAVRWESAMDPPNRRGILTHPNHWATTMEKVTKASCLSSGNRTREACLAVNISNHCALVKYDAHTRLRKPHGRLSWINICGLFNSGLKEFEISNITEFMAGLMAFTIDLIDRGYSSVLEKVSPNLRAKPLSKKGYIMRGNCNKNRIIECSVFVSELLSL